MKYFALLIILSACSFFAPSKLERKREVAQFKASNDNFDVALTRSEIFPNGINATYIKAKINIDETVDPKLLEVVSNGEIVVSKFTNTKGVWVASIQPDAGSEDITFYLQYKNYRSPNLEITTFNTPIKDKIEKYNFSPSLMSSFNDITFTKRDDAPEGIYEGFQIYNYGKNRIAPVQYSNRSFQFANDEFATQNMSFQVTDAPNEFTSHMMLSEFMIFPRNYLYNISPVGENFQVTLPTGEKMLFNKEGEIIGGVFDEGPIDISGDRFKRHYADLKYKGKGIILRANARGQMPQQGQFESTKIDMEYGIKYSADVLILNGTTGQRCRRPKSDFWTQADVSVIAFKFPTDKEFNEYLKSKCGFEIPSFGMEESSPEDISIYVNDIWEKCKSDLSPRSCVQENIRDITNKKTKTKVKFELETKINQLQKQEENALGSFVEKEALRIESMLKADYKWVQDSSAKNCTSIATEHVKLSLRFHDPKTVMTSALGLVCDKVQKEIASLIQAEAMSVYKKTISDLSWIDFNSKASTAEACTAKAQTFILDSFAFSHQKNLYLDGIQKNCLEIEKSAEYSLWLQENTSALEEKLKVQSITLLNTYAQNRALKCVSDFPVTSSLDRIRFKKQRDECLLDHWPVLEQFVLDDLKKDPMVQKAKYSVEPIRDHLSQNKRPIQLKLMKQYFN